MVRLKEQYKTIEEWLECETIFPYGACLYVVGSNGRYISDGKTKFNDLVMESCLDGMEDMVKAQIKREENE